MMAYHGFREDMAQAIRHYMARSEFAEARVVFICHIHWHGQIALKQALIIAVRGSHHDVLVVSQRETVGALFVLRVQLLSHVQEI